jgi:hypothetical protein
MWIVCHLRVVAFGFVEPCNKIVSFKSLLLRLYKVGAKPFSLKKRSGIRCNTARARAYTIILHHIYTNIYLIFFIILISLIR